MAALKKYNLEGKEVGTVELPESLLGVKANRQMIKDYIVALRNNARQWSANTKGRSEVACTTKKPHRQKGTGGARQGSLVAPQYRGGGIVFGPKPKFDQHVKINKKEKKAAILYLVCDMIKKEQVIMLEDTAIEAPKTKTLVNFLKATGMTKRVLFLGEGNYHDIEIADLKATISVKCDKHKNLIKSIRNIPKVEFSLAKNTNGYDLMLANHLVMTESSLNEMVEWLVG